MNALEDKSKSKKRSRKPTPHEDVVEGFAFLAFKNYEDLQRAVKLGDDGRKKVGKSRSVSTNTSPLAPKNKLKGLNKHKSKKLMDQENGNTVDGPTKPKKYKEPRLANHIREENGEILLRAKVTTATESGESKKSLQSSSNSSNSSNSSSVKIIGGDNLSLSEGSGVPGVPKTLTPLTKLQTTPTLPPPPPVPTTATNSTSTTAAGVEDDAVAGNQTTTKTNGHPACSTSCANTSPVAGTGPVNGVGETTVQLPSTSSHKVSSFFTPYAANAITRVNFDNGINGTKGENGAKGSSSNSTGKVTPTGGVSSSKSVVFGSIARLLDSPTTSSSSSNRSSPGGGGGVPPLSCHSPPSRDRDSYSSSVSSLSRSSVTPVSVSQTLSPQLPYSKAVNWLSTVPVPRPTLPAPPSMAPHPPLGSPFGSYPTVHPHEFQATSNELVRRDLESRFCGRDSSSLPLIATSSSSIYPPPPLFKDIQKVGLDTPFYRLPYSSPTFNGLVPQTPFAPPPSQLSTIPAKKTGRWNAMHVRISWEIYQNQNKGSSTTRATILKPSLPPSHNDLFRVPPPAQGSMIFPRQHDLYPTSMLRPPDQSFFLPVPPPHSLGMGYGGLLGLQPQPSPQEQWARLGRNGWPTEIKPEPFRERSPIRLSNGDSSSSDKDGKSRTLTPSSEKAHSSRMFHSSQPPQAPLGPTYFPYHHHPIPPSGESFRLMQALGDPSRYQQQHINQHQRFPIPSSQGKEGEPKDDR